MAIYLTSGKAVSGFCFAGVAYASAGFYQMQLPEVQRGEWISPIAALIGFAVGWQILGDQLNCDLRTAARRGVMTAFWLFVWAVILFSSAEMVKRAMERRSPNPGEAIGRVFGIMIEFASNALDAKVIASLVLGGVVSGVLAELANRRWH